MKAIFFNVPAEGHINPTLPVIREMIARGEHVICVNTEDQRAAHEAVGAQFIAYPAVRDQELRLERIGSENIARMALNLTQASERVLPWIFDLLDREQPDYIIHDSLVVWAKQAAEQRGIRAATSMTMFVMSRDAWPPVTPGLVLKLIAQILPALPGYWCTARRMRRTLGVRPTGLLNTLSGIGNYHVLYTSRAFQPGGDKFGEEYVFVGPTIDGRQTTGELPFELLPRQPVIYISLGTIRNENLSFYHTCFAAFRDHPAQFILSIGKRTDRAQLGTIPANFIVRDFVPQLEVLQRTDLFITHGGMNSVHESLWQGVPMIVIPQQAEQAVVARQVVKHGAGIALGGKPPVGQVNAAELGAAVERLLGDLDAYRAATQPLRASFVEAGGYRRAAEAFMSYGRRS